MIGVRNRKAHLEGNGGVQNSLPVQGLDKFQDKVQQKLQVHHGPCSRGQRVQLPIRPHTSSNRSQQLGQDTQANIVSEYTESWKLSSTNSGGRKRHCAAQTAVLASESKPGPASGTAEGAMQLQADSSEQSSQRTLSWTVPSQPPLPASRHLLNWALQLVAGAGMDAQCAAEQSLADWAPGAAKGALELWAGSNGAAVWDCIDQYARIQCSKQDWHSPAHLSPGSGEAVCPGPGIACWRCRLCTRARPRAAPKESRSR